MPKDAFGGFVREFPVPTIERGRTLQRLFSTFPNGWPGVGLLLIRLCLGISLIHLGAADVWEPLPFTEAASGIMLITGLWTPVIGTLVALDEGWIALSLHPPRRGDAWIRIFLAVLSLSVAMLGPGAWSIDARLFGRKRFDIDRTRGSKPSP
jgi:uncharacterized membrane protein YphA (DoxX/SURF4 family)